jgi:UDP-N-acetylmuramoyl-tripeptide--D-alanyl-D-alanine ligase
MQKLYRKIVFLCLRIFVKIKLKRIKPKIIGITGSYAKTSTKEALSKILEKRFTIRKNHNTFNTEYGICLDLLNINETGKIGEKHSYKKWFSILIYGFIDAFFSKEKYQILILELGIDRPNDIDMILKVIKPDIQIITGICLNHLEYGFESENDIWNEKKKLAYCVKNTGYVILNADDKYAKTAINDLKCNIISFGEKNRKANLFSHVSSTTIDGISAEFLYKHKKYHGRFNVLGKQHLTVINAAIAGALALSINIEDAINDLADYVLPARRMKKVNGINGSLILDSTFNASPTTTKAALDLLKELISARKIAVLGSMNELGKYSNEKHLEIGEYAANIADILLAIGHSSSLIKDGWIAKTNKAFFEFPNSKIASLFLKDFVKPGDLLLIKGSHSIEMEKITETLSVENNLNS